MRIGIQVASLRLPLRAALETAARLGVQGIELDGRELRPKELGDTAIRQLRKLLEDHNVKLCALSFMTRRGYDDLDSLDARVDATKEAMRLAYRLGASVVINQIGSYVPDTPGGARLLEVLTDLGRHSQRAGAWLAATTGGMPVERWRELFTALPEGSIGVNLDPGLLIEHGQSPAEFMGQLGEHVLHVHTTDAVRDLSRGRALETPLGRGSVDYAELLGRLEEHEYRGYMTVARPCGDEPTRAVTAAVQYLRAIQEG